jgi:hypothetical protein
MQANITNNDITTLANAIRAKLEEAMNLDDAHFEDAILAIHPIDLTVSLVDADDVIAADLGYGEVFDSNLDLYDINDLIDYDETADKLSINAESVSELATSYFELLEEE